MASHESMRELSVQFGTVIKTVHGVVKSISNANTGDTRAFKDNGWAEKCILIKENPCDVCSIVQFTKYKDFL